jgi:hypothetical protein
VLTPFETHAASSSALSQTYGCAVATGATPGASITVGAVGAL